MPPFEKKHTDPTANQTAEDVERYYRNVKPGDAAVVRCTQGNLLRLVVDRIAEGSPKRGRMPRTVKPGRGSDRVRPASQRKRRGLERPRGVGQILSRILVLQETPKERRTPTVLSRCRNAPS